MNDSIISVLPKTLNKTKKDMKQNKPININSWICHVVLKRDEKSREKMGAGRYMIGTGQVDGWSTHFSTTSTWTGSNLFYPPFLSPLYFILLSFFIYKLLKFVFKFSRICNWILILLMLILLLVQEDVSSNILMCIIFSFKDLEGL